MTLPSATRIISNVDQTIRLRWSFVASAHARGTSCAMLGLMARHGLRTIEVQRLDVADLRVRGDVPALYVRGKSRKDRWVYPRDDVVAALREWLATREPTDDSTPPFVALSNRRAVHA